MTRMVRRMLRWHRLAPPLGMLALLLVLGVALLYPVWLIVRGGFESAAGGWTLWHVRSVLTDPVALRGLANALGIAASTTVLALLIAVPLALALGRLEFPGRRAAGVLVLAPLVLPPFVGAIGFQHLLGRTGAVNAVLGRIGLAPDAGIDFIGAGGFWAIVVIEALHLYPILYLNARAAMSGVDATLEEAAGMLGAGPWRRVRTVVLPLMRPGLFAGATLVFIWSFTELGTPLMFDYRQVTPVQIFEGITSMTASARPYALTAVMLVSSVLVYTVGRLLFGDGVEAFGERGGATTAPRARLRGWRKALVTAAVAGVVAVALAPHAAVALVSVSEVGAWYGTLVPTAYTLDHYDTALGHPLAVGAVKNSLLYATGAVFLVLVFGLAIAHVVVRTRLPGRRLLDALAMLPIAVPGLVMAFGYVAVTLRWPFEGGLPPWLATALDRIGVIPASWIAALDDAPLGGVINVLGAEPRPELLLVIAYAVRRLPYAVRAIAAGLQQAPRVLEDAAILLGASRLRAVLTITTPLIAAHVLAGAVIAFVFSMLEVSDSLILAQREAHYPITTAIYSFFLRLGDGPYIASAMGVWAMGVLVAAGAFLVARSLSRHSSGMARL
ncbi:MAG: ABC transporter permease [Planctomycetota bacterium]|jgi:iron(III) transport system permease protein